MSNKNILELLDYLLKEISYVRTHTDEYNVLAGLNLMETKIKEWLKDE